MILLLVTNIVILIGEYSEIFHSKSNISFSSFKRITALVIAVPLFIATVAISATLPGKEIECEYWLTISLSISAF